MIERISAKAGPGNPPSAIAIASICRLDGRVTQRLDGSAQLNLTARFR